MKSSKSLFFAGVIILTMFVIAACGNSSDDASSNNNMEQTDSNSDTERKFEKMELTFGLTTAQGEPANLGAEQFADRVNKRTDGAVEIKIYPAEQLGSEVDMYDQVREGTLNFVFGGLVSSKFVDKGEIFSVPYAFEDWDEAKKILSGPVGQELFDEIEDETGLKIIDPLWYLGKRNFTSNREIHTPEDLKGLKLRVVESDLYVDVYKTLGASPTPISMGETYTALQQGVVDAQENPIPLIYSQKFYEVQDYIINTEHSVKPNMITTNADWFNSLSPELQKIISEEIVNAGEYHTKLQMEEEIEKVEDMKKYGVGFIDVDKEPFIEKIAPIYDKYENKWGADWVKKVKEAKEE